ncbi:ABC transporter permease [Devosia sp. XJ19-1]|uniref:ABC transporter permease n=1 Tax=Devosia ureilytica TaxID=2952754 RepID=UPI0020C781A3|nr:ABC transporter permease [Devosia ureilytica]MCP8884721.1 ABC transporter permease [Devosia ureilytica]
MLRFLLQRLALIALMLLVLSGLVFFLVQLLPGDLATNILGSQATPEQYAAMRAKLGLDQPVWVRYFTWLGDFLRGEWGHSVSADQPVRDLVLTRFGNTLRLAGVALAILIPSAIVAGVLAGLNEGKWIDKIISVGGATLTVIPEFVSGIILMIVFAVWLRWFPISATAPSDADFWTTVRHLILPSLPVVFVSFGYIAKMARSGTIEVLEAPYIRTATFKGLTRRQIVLRHVLRNALPPTISLSLLQASFIMGGLVVVEQLFTYPGLGKLLLDASTSHDVPTLEAAVLLAGIIVMVMTLLADLTLALLDPRVRVGG